MPARFGAAPPPIAPRDLPSRDLKNVVAELKNEQIREAIAACGGNKKKAAALLGISRSFLYKKLAEMGEIHDA